MQHNFSISKFLSGPNQCSWSTPAAATRTAAVIKWAISESDYLNIIYFIFAISRRCRWTHSSKLLRYLLFVSLFFYIFFRNLWSIFDLDKVCFTSTLPTISSRRKRFWSVQHYSTNPTCKLLRPRCNRLDAKWELYFNCNTKKIFIFQAQQATGIYTVSQHFLMGFHWSYFKKGQ